MMMRLLAAGTPAAFALAYGHAHANEPHPNGSRAGGGRPRQARPTVMDENPSTPSTRALTMRAGALAPFEGLVYLLQHRNLWPYAVFPTLLGLLWSLLWLAGLLVPGGGAWWAAALAFVFHAAIAVAIFFIHIGIALSAPLLDWLGEQTEEAMGALPQGPPFWRELISPSFWIRSLRVIIEALKLLVAKLVLAVIAFIIGWIPVIGQIASVVLYGASTGLDFLDYALGRRELSLGEKLAWYRRHAAGATAFGVVVFGLLAVPGIGGLMLAPCVVGGTRLVLTTGAADRRPYAIAD